MSQSSQFSLLKQRRFAPFFWTQFLVEMGTFVAILIGTIGGGELANYTRNGDLIGPTLTGIACLVIAVSGWLTARGVPVSPASQPEDRKSTRLNSSHTVIYTLSYTTLFRSWRSHRPHAHGDCLPGHCRERLADSARRAGVAGVAAGRSEEHTSELQSHSDLHSFLHDALPILAISSAPRSRGLPAWSLP